MTLRITLLVLVTGLFALIWTHDQHPDRQPDPRIASMDPQENHSSNPRLKEEMEFGEAMPEVEVPRPAWLKIELSHHRQQPKNSAGKYGNDSKGNAATVPVSLCKTSPTDHWKLGDAEMPCPAGLVPGEYRAVSNTGIVRNLTVTLAELQTRRAGKAKFITRDVYRSHGKRFRWHFIRVQSDSGKTFPVIVQRGTHIIRPAVAPRGTHKITPAVAQKDRSPELRRQASQIIVGAGQRFFQKMATRLRNGHQKKWDSVRDHIHPATLSTEESDEKSL